MKTIVSDQTRLAIFNHYQAKEKKPEILEIKLGLEPGTILWCTIAGTTTCTITEDEDFFYFQMPLKTGKIPKKSFFD